MCTVKLLPKLYFANIHQSLLADFLLQLRSTILALVTLSVGLFVTFWVCLPSVVGWTAGLFTTCMIISPLISCPIGYCGMFVVMFPDLSKDFGDKQTCTWMRFNDIQFRVELFHDLWPVFKRTLCHMALPFSKTKLTHTHKHQTCRMNHPACCHSNHFWII